MPVFTANQIMRVGVAIFEAAGTPSDEAKQTADLLVKSNLCGHDSHGVIRIPGYIEGIIKGSCKPGSKIKILRDSGATALVDGGWGLGQVVATQTMNLAIEKADGYGIGAVSTFNCCHIGRIADYILMAPPHGMIGICAVISGAGVAPYGGIERMFNQSPIGIAIPAGDEAHFMLDISTSVCAGGKIMHALAKGDQLPEGYIIDKDGNPTTDPKDFVNGGAVLPFGGPVAYKGYGLAMAVDAIAGILSGRGSAFSRANKGQGVFQMAIKIDLFRPIDEFKADMDKLVRAVKDSKKAPGFDEILIPGELELRSEKEKIRTGIDVPQKTWDRILETAKKVNVNLNDILES
jgi:LDH2 family malate/lactate/ureidoglycolate dehydrogenase